MSRIFISYRREDSAWQAGRIYDRLADRFGREAIFKDVDAIKAGDNFQECINEAVGQCDVLLAVIGQRWLTVTDSQGRRRLNNSADWVRLEIETALNRGDVQVIPVLLDKVSMPTAQDLPASLQPLCYRHAAYVRQDPDFSRDIEYVLNTIEQRIGKTERANNQWPTSNLFDRALAMYRYERALAKQNKGDLKGAITDYDKAIQLNPAYVDAYINRGLAKSALGDKLGEIADYDKAIQANPEDAKPYYNLGVSKSDLGDKLAAIAAYDKAIQLKSDYAKAYNNRGSAKSALGDRSGASLDFQQAMELSKLQGNTELYNLAQGNLMRTR